jgi:hypothetical protein
MAGASAAQVVDGDDLSERLVSPWMVITAMASSSAPADLLVEADTSRALNTS